MAQNAKFPSWAPEDLSNLYRGPRLLKDEDYALLYRMLTSARMESVWKLLRGKRDVEPPTGSISLWLFHATREALKEANSDLLTKNEYVRFYNELSEGADSLADKLGASPLNDNPDRWFPDPAAHMIRQQVRIVFDFGDKYRGKWPTMADLLYALAAEAKNRSTDALQSPELPDKHTKNAARSVFVRILAREVRQVLGSPHYRILGHIAATALDDDLIDESTVRQTLRGLA